MTKPSEFISTLYKTLILTPRGPHQLTADSEFANDFEQIFKSVVRRSVNFDYQITGMKVSESKQVELRLVDSKGSFFDLIAFFSITGLVIALQFACKFVGVSSEKKDKDS